MNYNDIVFWKELIDSDSETFEKVKTNLLDFVTKSVQDHTPGYTDSDREYITTCLIKTVPFAIKKYLGGKNDDYSFPVYFTWYIHEALTTYDPKTKTIESQIIQEGLK